MRLFCAPTKQKPLKIKRLRGVLSTEGRDRTGTSVTSSVFETDASTDSATSAWSSRLNEAAKLQIFSIPAYKNRNFSVFVLSAQRKSLLLQPEIFTQNIHLKCQEDLFPFSQEEPLRNWVPKSPKPMVLLLASRRLLFSPMANSSLHMTKASVVAMCSSFSRPCRRQTT